EKNPSASYITMNQGLRILKSMTKRSEQDQNKRNAEINNMILDIIEHGKSLNQEAANLGEINHAMYNEVKSATKLNPFSSIESQEKNTEQFRAVISGKHFIRIVYEIVVAFSNSYRNLAHICRD